VDLIRRNTDYAVRLITTLASQFEAGKVLSARTLASENSVPYTLACKLLQKYQQSGVIKSIMGPKGGFTLARRPSEITLLELIETIQGNIHINRCFASPLGCPNRERCPLNPKLADLQEEIQRYLRNTTLAELLKQPENTSIFRSTGQ
jgi:Rrf2 family protein